MLFVQIVNEMASAAGLPCDIDPALCAALRAQKLGILSHITKKLINPVKFPKRGIRNMASVFFPIIWIAFKSIFILPDAAEDEYTVACLLMVFVAVSLPKLARNESTVFKPVLEGTPHQD